ncbi:hypothetical protein HK096_004816 [Nowakowskiella sp. JEL0078]|nr:hypothetical protein HK096_004816 [Nowakowskiella sp. JEL0078]
MELLKQKASKYLFLSKSNDGQEVVSIDPANSQNSNEDNVINSDEQASYSQAGVDKLEAVTAVLTNAQWYLLYGGILVVAFIFGLDGQTNYSLSAAITSSFEAHSSLGILTAIGLVLDAIVKVPFAKIANVIGRAESFTASLVFYIIGLSLMCHANDFGSYAVTHKQVFQKFLY